MQVFYAFPNFVCYLFCWVGQHHCTSLLINENRHLCMFCAKALGMVLPADWAGLPLFKHGRSVDSILRAPLQILLRMTLTISSFWPVNPMLWLP
mmetsp:Transcript_2433/g.6601  ORF Transcript_2433/g.6601 Transcript_2433/m.6601 type:complete len:94 (-) Transcript_2433:1055-1336(-)